jgi:hypothetical protein
MESIENEIVLTSQASAAPPAETGNYAAVRFNALKHGILSRYTVLPHEDAEEYGALLAALVEEHQPAGATEAHLVEELAGIIWRKRRVLQAEGATINRGLRGTVYNAETIIPAAAPFEFGLSEIATDLRDVMGTTPESLAEWQRDSKQDLEATYKAAAILRKGGPKAYEKARRALWPDSRNSWDEKVEDEKYAANAEGLAEYIWKELQPLCIRMEKEARLTPAIKMQALGGGFQVHRLEGLTRYETHLDRKFERTLAMLVKLKELRARRELPAA